MFIYIKTNAEGSKLDTYSWNTSHQAYYSEADRQLPMYTHIIIYKGYFISIDHKVLLSNTNLVNRDSFRFELFYSIYLKLGTCFRLIHEITKHRFKY